MREQIKFGLVQTEEAFQQLVKFAKSFDHNVGPDSILPIYTIDRGQRLIGYFNVLCYPIVAPAMHPRVCTPRDFYEAIHILKNHFCINSICEKFPNGTGFMAVPNELAFSKSILERCGFKNSNKVIWQAIP